MSPNTSSFSVLEASFRRQHSPHKTNFSRGRWCNEIKPGTNIPELPPIGMQVGGGALSPANSTLSCFSVGVGHEVALIPVNIAGAPNLPEIFRERHKFIRQPFSHVGTKRRQRRLCMLCKVCHHDSKRWCYHSHMLTAYCGTEVDHNHHFLSEVEDWERRRQTIIEKQVNNRRAQQPCDPPAPVDF